MEIKKKKSHLQLHQKNKILRNKFNQEVNDLYIENKTLNKLKMTQINGDFHVHGMEESKLLECPYSPKQSTDSMQFLSKFQLQK